MRRSHRRSQTGGFQVSEFGAALFLLVSCIVIPLIDLAVIPIRWGLGRSILSNQVNQLAQCDTLSQAFNEFATDTTFKRQLSAIGGITLCSSQLSLSATSVRNPAEKIRVERSGALKSEWLPGGAKSPCVYQLDLVVNADISPLMLARLPSVNIPGLTQPLLIRLEETSAWENLARDPSSGEFYVNR